MRSHSYISLFLIFGILSSCQNCSQSDVVCQTYVHRYGVPLPPEDWTERGRHGQVISVRKDGVEVAQSYDNGILSGETTYTFPHSQTIQRKEQYVQGELIEETFYYSSGFPKQQTVFEFATRQVVTSWFESGELRSREVIDKGLLEEGQYYDLNHQIDSKVENFNGFITRRDGHGGLLSVDTIEGGEVVCRTTYHMNGTPASVASCVKGVIEGTKKTFLITGEPITIEEWHQNKQEGITTVFENGEKCAEVPYVNGYKHGIERRFKNGTLVIEETSWVKGQRHGPCYRYVGQALYTDWFFRDRLVNKATYDMLCNQ